MIRKIRESIIKYCKFWFIAEEEEEKQSPAIPVWFPATKDHEFD